MAPSSKWCNRARMSHLRAAGERDIRADDVLVGGEELNYGWSQTDDEVEVRVKLPEGAAAEPTKVTAKKVLVTYEGGSALVVSCEKRVLVDLRPLFAKVDVDGCAWTVDKGEVVVSMEKADARPWTMLLLSGSASK
mmetsp:Transcript_22258/g.45785  ORF Transcript_22258/g.45785 Transcript_22258/m.45785 type:complete len:136 (-) Transcript_22258:99-506(-)